MAMSLTDDHTLTPFGDRKNRHQMRLYIPAQEAADSPGLIVFGNVDGSGTLGNGVALWADNTGVLRYGADIPTNEDSDGTVLGGATTELDNLGTTAINAHLLFATANTYDVGADPESLRTLYWTTSLKKIGTTYDVTLAVTEPGAASYTYTFPDAAANADVMLDTGGSNAITVTSGTSSIALASGNTDISLGAGANITVGAAGDVDFGTGAVAFNGSAAFDLATAKTVNIDNDVTIQGDVSITAALTASATCTLDQDLQVTASPTFNALTVTSITDGTATLTGGAASGISTLATTSHVTLGGDNVELRIGAAGATDSKVWFDATALRFYDSATASAKPGGYTLNELATGTTLNPTVNGNLAISDGTFTWTNNDDEAATWTLSNTTNDGIDLAMAGLTTANGLHIVADAVTTGKVIHVQSDHSGAAGALIYLDWLESGGNADGRYITCYDGTQDVVAIKKTGEIELLGADNTDMLTITKGHIQLDDGKIEIDVDSNISSYIKKADTGAGAGLILQNTASGNTGYVLDIDQVGNGAAGAVRILSDGDSAILSLASSGSARDGDAIDVDHADFLDERALYAHGAITSKDNEGTIEVAATGVLAAGANLLRLVSSGNQTAASYVMEIVNSGTPTGATDGTALLIDDDTGAAATSYAVCIDAATNEAFRVKVGKSLFDEEAEFDGGINVDADSTLDGKLTITASDAANVDALVIDQNDTASTSGILVTFSSDGAGVRVTNEKVDGVSYEAICGVDATTENMMYIDGGAAARWIGADDYAMLKLHTDSDFAHAGASMLHIDRAVGTVAASTQGSCLRLVDKSDTGSGYAMEIDSSGNCEALNVVAGASLFAEKVTFTTGQQSAAVARAATANGTGTGTIADGESFITVTVTTNADDIIILPTPTPGNVVWLLSDAIAYELRSSAPATIAINGGTGATAESAVAAADLLTRAVCLSATKWIVTHFAADGTESAADAAA